MKLKWIRSLGRPLHLIQSMSIGCDGKHLNSDFFDTGDSFRNFLHFLDPNRFLD